MAPYQETIGSHAAMSTGGLPGDFPSLDELTGEATHFNIEQWLQVRKPLNES